MKLVIYYERLDRIGQKPIVYLACRTGILFLRFSVEQRRARAQKIFLSQSYPRA